MANFANSDCRPVFLPSYCKIIVVDLGSGVDGTQIGPSELSKERGGTMPGKSL